MGLLHASTYWDLRNGETPVVHRFITHVVFSMGPARNCPWGRETITITEDDIDNNTNKMRTVCNRVMTRASKEIFCENRGDYDYSCKGDIDVTPFRIYLNLFQDGAGMFVICGIEKRPGKRIKIRCSKEQNISDENNDFCCEDAMFPDLPEDCKLKVICESDPLLQTCSITSPTTKSLPTATTTDNVLPATTVSRITDFGALATSTRPTPIVTATAPGAVSTEETSTPVSKITGTDPSGRKDTSNSNSSATLAGGIIGGILFGVVITIIVVVMWRKYRNRRRLDALIEDEKADSPVSMTAGGPSDGNVSAAVPDVIDIDRPAHDGSSKIYQEVGADSDKPSFEDNSLEQGVHGEYTYITDEKLNEMGSYSLGKALPQPTSSNSHLSHEAGNCGDAYSLAKTFPQFVSSSKEAGSGENQSTYNRLGAASEVSSQKPDTYNRIGESMFDERYDQNFPSDDYNKLNVKTVHANKPSNEYDRVTGIEFTQSANGHQDTSSSDYFVLETNDETQETK